MKKLLIGKSCIEEMSKEINSSIEKKENIVISSHTSDYYDKYKKVLEEKNYHIFVLNLENTNQSNSYNPLILPYNIYKSGNKDKAIDLITTLAHEIFCESLDSLHMDPFWENCATDYFISIVLTLFQLGKEEEINLGSVQAMITLGERKIDDTSVIRKYFDSLDVLNSVYIAASTTVYAAPETRMSIISVVRQKLNIYCIREMLLNNLCGNDIDLTNIKGETAIFVINHKSNSTNRIGNILIDQLNEIKEKFTFYLDINNNDRIFELNHILDSSNICITVRAKKDFTKMFYDETKLDEIKEVTEEENFYEIEELPVSKLNENHYFNIEKYVTENL